jgi:hypothetical protein
MKKVRKEKRALDFVEKLERENPPKGEFEF